jgi:hypothetical protein
MSSVYEIKKLGEKLSSESYSLGFYGLLCLNNSLSVLGLVPSLGRDETVYSLNRLKDELVGDFHKA